MVLRRGRLKFRQYIKGKRYKFGIKLYVLCETSGIALKILACAELSGERHTEKVMLALTAEKLDNGHSLYMDSVYNSGKLTQDLLLRKPYVIETLRTNRQENPEAVVKKKLKKDVIVAQYNSKGICMINWKDPHEILAISSEYNASIQNVITQRTSIEKEKPLLINKYSLWQEFTIVSKCCHTIPVSTRRLFGIRNLVFIYSK